MQLIQVLLVAAAIVVLLSGVSIFFGSSKQEKTNAIRFLVAALGASIWTIAMTIFIHMPDASTEFSHIIVTCIIGGVTLCDIGLLAFLGWNYKGGKPATVIFTIVGITLVALLACDSSLFYTSIDVNREYTQLFINHNWYYFALIAYFFLISITFSGFLQKRIKATTNRGLKKGLQVFYIGVSIGGILALVFNLILITSQPQLVWIGPIATLISIMSFYYSVVKFRTISISTKWMEVMSSVILIAMAAIIYLLAFYAIFSALFGIPNPSKEILLLNITMAIFLLLLMPTIIETTNFMRANFYIDRIELGYITKKIESIDKNNLDLKDISKFLSDSMHYSYIAFEIGGRIYTTDTSKFTTVEVEHIARAKSHDHDLWIKPNEFDATIAESHNISKIGILTNKNGKEIGKLIFGKRIAEGALSRKDQVKQEAIMGLLSVIIEDNLKK